MRLTFSSSSIARRNTARAFQLLQLLGAIGGHEGWDEVIPVRPVLLDVLRSDGAFEQGSRVEAEPL